MKIIVNQKAIEDNLITSANQIIELANQKASEGISWFIAPIPNGVNCWSLISKVGILSEGSVECAYRGISKGVIKFRIIT